MAVNAAPDGSPARVAGPCRLRRLIRSTLWRSAARGLAAVLVVTAIVVPLVCLGWTMLAIFAAITVGLNVGLWAGRDSGLASLAGALLLPIVGLVFALGTDVQVIGTRTGPIALADIQRFPYAAQFRFTDARVATEFTSIADRRKVVAALVSGTWRVAPIVPTNWTPAEPVPAWAVAVVTGYGPLDFRTPRNWQQNYRAGIRYVPTAISPARDAVAGALAHFGLTAARDAPLLYWVDEPASVIADERTFVAWVVFGGIVTWLFFLIGEALLVPVPVAGDAESGLPKRPRPT
ncbi:MAG TPA: hypothetical protein VGH49_08125 [Xanthobacteraceae bacterium]|jgi:hypothetical protein